MSDCETYIRIDGEPFLSRAKAYRERYHAWRLAWSRYAKSKGATGHSTTGHNLIFDGCRPPEGWVQPDSKKRSRPKKGHVDAADMAQMRVDHPRPSSSEVYGGAACTDLSYEGEGVSGSSGIGGIGLMINGPHVGWAGDTFLGHIPDAEAAVREHLAAHPDHRIAEPAASWRLPDGLIRLSKAEYDLVFAQYAVEQERDTTPSPSTARRAR